ncbi:hypothetical protein MSP8887_00693 [Marinomonas spartinae]|uniref:Na(+)-translocating NADH-quinone reductase subunit B n=1 Tax=Marinomonas spartinae TaxID=1792290 RepID=A0A1A8T9K5_9GAMM|nr:DUF6482 family protein [Marinomonas spartinae]SBS27626.1 hypothetical protein MSP8887_00693 [Marinomonas spartinae]SBS28683.1 hypothetical protein MSP8886_01274 [Marinomonas spartinae]
MTLEELNQVALFDKVKIHSLESNLYQLSVVLDGEESFVMNDKGRCLTSHNKLDLQALFKDKQVAKMVLVHQSAYDEMVGQPVREGGNVLEVSLGNHDLS